MYTIHTTAQSVSQCVPRLKALLEKGADTALANGTGKTPLDLVKLEVRSSGGPGVAGREVARCLFVCLFFVFVLFLFCFVLPRGVHGP